ncbi:MAG: hypothetical protein GY793_07215 [Proteobacteria bacterium]|nr:hypothetical protein [Pseudomonadota bacterium]
MKLNKVTSKRMFPGWEKDKISIMHVLFLAEYCTNGFNATEAYISQCISKYKRENKTYNRADCTAAASLVLKRPEVIKTLGQFISETLSEKKNILEKELFDILWKRAFYNITMFVTPQGNPCFTDWDQVPIEWLCVLDGIERRYHGKDAIPTVSLKLADRDKALDKLDRYIDMTNRDIDLNVHKGIERIKMEYNGIVEEIEQV